MTIAAWFISQAKAGQEEPSSQKVRTLIGRAQSHYRARYGRPLLAEPMPVCACPAARCRRTNTQVKASVVPPSRPARRDNDVSTEHGVDLAHRQLPG